MFAPQPADAAGPADHQVDAPIAIEAIHRVRPFSRTRGSGPGRRQARRKILAVPDIVAAGQRVAVRIGRQRQQIQAGPDIARRQVHQPHPPVSVFLGHGADQPVHAGMRRRHRFGHGLVAAAGVTEHGLCSPGDHRPGQRPLVERKCQQCLDQPEAGQHSTLLSADHAADVGIPHRCDRRQPDQVLGGPGPAQLFNELLGGLAAVQQQRNGLRIAGHQLPVALGIIADQQQPAIGRREILGAEAGASPLFNQAAVALRPIVEHRLQCARRLHFP